MTHDIFLSYKREDEARAARLAKALEADGFSVWWDRSLLPAESWRAQIEAALDAARCVIVIWTKESAGPAGDFVRDEAARAKARDVLVPVMMQKTRLPLGFGEMQYVDLIGWRGGRGNIFFKDLVAACRAKIEGRDVPRPKGPLRRAMARTGLGGGVFAALAFGFLADVASVQKQACSLAYVQPGLSDICGALGLGDKPTREARLAFEALPPGDCAALEGFRDRFETSPLRAIADSRLANPRIMREERWEPYDRQDPVLFQPAYDPPAASEADARAATLARAQEQAETVCRGFATGETFRYLGAAPRDLDWRCEVSTGGHVCSVEGFAGCQVEELRVTETRSCGPA